MDPVNPTTQTAGERPKLIGVARAVYESGLLSLEKALVFQETLLVKKAKAIEDLGPEGISPYQVAKAIADIFHFPLLDLSDVDKKLVFESPISERLMREHELLGLWQRGKRLFCAMADPTQMAAISAVEFQTGLSVEPVVVEYDKLVPLVRLVRHRTDAMTRELGAEVAREEAQETREVDLAQEEVEDAPVVRFIRKILMDAIESNASDIHLEPYESFMRVRYRLDGVLHEVAEPPVALRERLAARLKILSRMDIAEKRLPQDGRIRLAMPQGEPIDFRVSSLPTLFGEKIVLRILKTDTSLLHIDRLGLEPRQKEWLLEAIGRPYGMIIVTGPTGSGKTVTLYTCLKILNQVDINISTAEDPVEIIMPGLNQVQINERAGLTFANAMRAFLRQDPDVIMVGEMRDFETADIAIKAAQTGHLVFSTLHTNDAPSSVERLRNMGVAPFNIASSLLLLVAQRLVRRLCPTCKTPQEMTKEALLANGFSEEDSQEPFTVFAPKGCHRCNQTGYKGRVAIYQMLKVTPILQEMILKNASTLELEAQSMKEEAMNLRQAGLLKVKAGVTSLAEVEGMTNI